MPSSRDYPRALRVNEVLRQVVAEELERLADADERLRLVTVTSVDTGPDLRPATVCGGTLGKEAAEALEAAQSGTLNQAAAQALVRSIKWCSKQHPGEMLKESSASRK